MIQCLQLMRPGIGRNMSRAVGDFAQHLGLFLGRCGSLIVRALQQIALAAGSNILSSS